MKFRQYIKKLKPKRFELRRRAVTLKKHTGLITGLILGPVLLFVIGNLFYILLTGSMRSNMYNGEILQMISSDFDDGYDLKIIQEQSNSYGSPSIFVFANDKRIKDFCADELFPDINLLKPILRVYEKRSDFISNFMPFIMPYRKVFDFTPEFPGSNAEAQNLFIVDYQIADLDKNGTKEILLKMMYPACGSGATVYSFVFEITSNGYELTETLPYMSYFREQKPGYSYEQMIKEAVKNNWKPFSPFPEEHLLFKKKNISIQSSHTDDLVEYKDLDGDSMPELVIAFPVENCFDESEWTDKCEAHWSPHLWIIGVYRYKDGQFIIDNNFNDSLLLVTKNKYDLYDMYGYRPLPVNDYGVISGYYGLGFFGVKDKDFSFEFSQRKRSVVWDLIKPHYRGFKE